MTIAKAADAIEALIDARRPIRLAELAERLGVPKSSVHRLTTSLIDVGLVGRDESGLLGLGHRMLVWSAAADATYRIRDVAEPLMSRLRDETGETVNLHIRMGTDRVCLLSVHGNFALVPIVRPGQRMPLGTGASGRLLLAFAPDEVVTEVRGSLARSGRAVPSDLELQRWREDPWVEISDEIEPGLAVAATVVRQRFGAGVAVITIGGSSARLGAERFAALRPLLTGCAAQIGEHLGDVKAALP